MAESLRVLILEDRPEDAEMMVRELRQSGYAPEWKCVATEADFAASLAADWDLILADYVLPGLNAVQALALVRGRSLDVPFILVTGSVGEETAVECMHAGADDYVLKDRMARLGPAVRRTLERKRANGLRRQAESALREREAVLRTVFHSSADLITIADMETGVYLQVNDGFLQATGYARDEAIGKTGDDLRLWMQPDRRREIVRRLSQGQEVRNEETWFRKKDGTPFIGLLTAEVIQIAGRPALLCIVRDITERKRMEDALRESEERYRDLFEHMPSGAVVYVAVDDGADFIIKDFNSAAERIEEVRRGDVIGKRVTEAFPSVEDFGLLRVLRDVWKSGREAFHPASVYTNGTGRRTWRESWVYRLPNGDVVAVYNDITERKQAEEKIRESEETYRNLFQNAQVGLYRTRIADGKILESNEQLARMFGYDSREEFIREYVTSQNYVDPGTRERMLELIQRDGYVKDFEARFYRKDRSIFWARYSARFYPDKGWIEGVAEDITEVKQAEEALRRRDAILEAVGLASQILLRSPDWEKEMHVVLGRLGRSSDASRTYIFENAPGPDGEVLTSQRYEWVKEGVTPQIDNPMLQNFPLRAYGFGRWVDILGSGQPVFGKVRDFPEGERPALESQDILSLAVVPIFASGEWWGFLGFDDCRTEREWQPMEIEALRMAANLLGAAIERKRAEQALRESEARYRALVNLSPDGIWVHRHGEVLFANAAAAAMFGAKSPDDLLGRQALDFVAPEYREMVWERIKRGQEQREPAPLMEEKLLRVDGTEFYADVCAVPIEWAGEPAVQVIIRDSTVRKQMEERLLQAQKMEVVGRLAGGIAHDFNNILTAINGYATFALESLPPGDPVRADVEQVLASAERAANLTHQLLAFSRRQMIEQRTINLSDLILNLEKMLRRLIGEDVELVVIPGEGLAQVKADPGQLEQVLVNLAVNARDAMPNGGKLIIETANVALDEEFARGHPGAEPGDYVLLSITDTGIGMSDEVKAHLFEPFFTTKEPGKGTGLGLATVYGIVKQHGGNIYAYSELGKGTTFKIYLPAVEAVAERLPRRDEAGFVPRGTETVLVAEDEANVRAIVARTLTEQGYTVLEAADGNEALRLAREYAGEIHLLLTDVVMPQIGGKELSEQFAAIRPGVKTLFVSGYTDNAIVHRGVLEPGITFLQKPFTAAALARKVRQVLDAE